ncbi:ral guanine nucleotide dissociation stimulator-like isoform X2 [Erinaceus europaeus]|uniref:Ral guanine nucleotide dissociation stimulator-like isoform X2 n=1 Tax=Erinaceus europaeus TaxID=9365 RepID=A0ABM3XKW6_ERIEU|nr:ral guanine nucleotide dissociation stimulator-like isoform X2 [Erinaceus europaeus]
MFSCCIPCLRETRTPCCWKLLRCCTCCCNPSHCCLRLFARKLIKTGAVEKMVEYLVPAVLGHDPTYIHTFLSSYRALATTQQVLDLLFSRAISSILSTWLEKYPEDFYQPPDFTCLKTVLAYVQLGMPGSALEHHVLQLLTEMEKHQPTETKTGPEAGKIEAKVLIHDLEPEEDRAAASPAEQRAQKTAHPKAQKRVCEAPPAADSESVPAGDTHLIQSLDHGPAALKTPLSEPEQV